MTNSLKNLKFFGKRYLIMRLAIIRLALLIIPSGMICFLGCSSPNSLQIISLENGNIISLEDKFLSQQSLLASGNDNRSFWTIAKNCSNQMAILKYNLYGKLQYKITLPFSFSAKRSNIISFVSAP